MINTEIKSEKKEQKELNIEEKRQLGEVWSKVILGRGQPPENIEEMPDNEIRDWLSSSLMSEIKILSDEWGIAPDQELIDGVREDIDVVEKSKRQMAYIEKCLENINNFTRQNREEKQKRSKHWDSWPKTMRENQDFNCVGATMLGADLLNRAGIENYYGNPSGHILNIVELADGRLVYADFRNDLITEIKPEEVSVTGVRTLKIDNDGIDYQLIPILDKNGLAEAALGNLNSLIKEVEDSDDSNLSLHEIEARKIVQEDSDVIGRANVYDIYYNIFLESMSVHSSDQMRAEEKRIKLAWEFEDSLKELTAEIINNIGQKESLKLMLDNIDQIEAYLSGLGELSSLPIPIRNVLEKIKISLDELAKKDEKLALKMQNKILFRIRNT